MDGLRFPLLGLYGEVGSLLSALKKKQRDSTSYVAYEEDVMEEFGDVLWYFANIAARAGVGLSAIAQRVSRDLTDWDACYERNPVFFSDLQPARKRAEVAHTGFEQRLIELAGKVGCLLDDVALGRIERNRDVLAAHLLEIFRALVVAAYDAEICLDEAARQNIQKTLSRWPKDRICPPLFDEGDDAEEQLPRRIEMNISERANGGKPYVRLRCNEINIGDRLTDNKTEQDDYRFHDVFHLACAAILGWSPVMRALFKVKRKSRPKVDENEDGARATLVEESISTWIFSHALRLNYFESIHSLDYPLLKAIHQQVAGYEVARCPLWLWEKAILDGYSVFRRLRAERRGIVIADLHERTISFRSIE